METMKMIAFGIVALAFLTAGFFYPQMPDRMATHWNIEGVADGYGGKEVGVFLMPFLSLALVGVLWVLPKLDPLRKNYDAFMKEYQTLTALIIGFIYYIYLLTLAFNLGYQFEFIRFFAPALGILFYYMGAVMEKTKQNWFVGVRTPWTLSSEAIWNKTHRITADLFRAAGIVAGLGAVFPPLLIASLAVLLASAVFSVVYSYFEFQGDMRE